ISVHGTCGAWGVLALGLFADDTYGAGWNAANPRNVAGLFYGDPGQLAAQVMHVVVGFAWAWGITWLIFKFAKSFMQIRVAPEVEIEGLDVPEFGVLCYPDFVLHRATAGHVIAGTEEIDVTTPLGVRS